METFTFTAYVSFGGIIEEIDVTAGNLEDARQQVEEILEEDYQPGGVIKQITRQSGYFA